MLSKCCHHKLNTNYGDEGTNCYICEGCGYPSDPVGGYDLEKLDQQLDIMLEPPRAYRRLVNRLRLSLALWIMKTAIMVANWLRPPHTTRRFSKTLRGLRIKLAVLLQKVVDWLKV